MRDKEHSLQYTDFSITEGQGIALKWIICSLRSEFLFYEIINALKDE
jgi:hypothetical protein